MADIEKVVWSLERCASGVPDACRDCKYDNFPPRICVAHLTKDALELLKEQQPRVLTLDELEFWDGAAYFECYKTDAYYVLIKDFDKDAGMNGEFAFVDTAHGTSGWRVWECEHYNKIWRCWNKKPTFEQMEAVKWDG